MEKAEVLNDFFASVFTGKSLSHTAQVTEGGDWENAEPPTVGEDQVREYLRNLKVHKCIMGPDELHQRVLRELADEVAKKATLRSVKRKTQGTTGWSVSPLCLARLWSRPSWRLC
ncbi:mitochondrial enolase superfamily member 1 [Grus japonensis]|uniref:Mitochondrial enolase superfamily member 1 n=1 Tax=Grus japonensis TaxID=30415 RepID=A0ABC9VYU5_GRUJA